MSSTGTGGRKALLEEASHWHVTLQAGDASDAELLRWQRWMEQSSEHAAAFDDIDRLWQAAGQLDATRLREARHDPAGAGNPAPAQTPPPTPAPARAARQPARRTWRPWAAAAVATLALVLVAGVLMQRPPAAPDVRTLATAIGERRQVQLDDGSTLVLDAASEAVVRYGADERHIRIERGRAYFDVAHEAQRPFVVEAGDVSSRALGTRFAVGRGPGGGVSLTVIEGRVRVGTGAMAAAARPQDVLRDQRVDYTPAGGFTRPVDINAGMATAWRDGTVVYQSEPLSRVIEDLNRYSHRPVRLEQVELGPTEVTGLWQLDDLDAWINGLAASLDLEVRRTQEAIVLARRTPASG